MKFSTRHLCLLAIIGLLSVKASSQVQIGEVVKDIKLDNLINSANPEINLSDFKGKLLLLDFWSLNCANCIESFPDLDSLQRRLNDKIKIVLVNHESRQKTLDFFKKRKGYIKRPNLLFVTGDTILRKMFPKDYVPWIVWIDKDQRFRLASDEIDLTEKGILSFLQGKFNGTPIVPHPDFKQFTSLLEQTNKDYLKAIQFCSYISKYEDGLSIGGNGYYLVEPGKMRLVQVCKSIEELLVTAFSEDFARYDFVKSNIFLEVSDTFKFRSPEGNSKSLDYWTKTFAYNYDCILPVSSKDQAYKIMQQELIRVFNLDVSIEKRITKSLVLVRIGNVDKIRSSGKDKPIPFDTTYTIYNYPFKKFFADLKSISREFEMPYSLIDETGLSEYVDIVGFSTRPFRQQHPDIPAMRMELQKFGLDLIEREQLNDVLVIKEKGGIDEFQF